MNPVESKAGLGLTIKKEKEVSTPSAISIASIKDLKASIGANRIGSTSRLPSFKGPRDLTLSTLGNASSIQPQIARAKKTFVPNILVRREKGDSKIIESKSEKINKKSPSKPRQGDHGRGRGRGREYIQTRGSLFGEGIAASSLKRSTNSYGYHDGKASGSTKSGEMQRPVLNTEVAYNINKEHEDKRLKEILRDDFIDDDDATITDNLPVQLPMIAKTLEVDVKTDEKKEKWKRRNSLAEPVSTNSGIGPTAVKIKQEVDEEKEKCEDAKTLMNGFIQDNSTLHRNSELSVIDLLSKSQSDVMFFQLPSCLPGHPPEAAPTTTPTQKSKEQNSEPVCTLGGLPEGRIGSLKVYASGRTELCLGGYNMELSLGTPVGFLQDVVRIDVDNEQKTGSMVVLGHVKDRLVCTPDFEALTQKAKSS